MEAGFAFTRNENTNDYMNDHTDQLPDSLIAQLVEHCTRIAEVMGPNPVQAWIFFFQALISQLLKFCA